MRFLRPALVSLCFAPLLFSCGMARNDLSSQQDPGADTKISEIVASIQNAPNLLAKLKQASESFMDAPYSLTSLGDGDERGPLYRSDVFDCTTLVETVLAIAHAKSLDEFKVLMNTLRYKDGKPSLLSRNHMPDGDWIPNNVARGFFQDVTHPVAQNAHLPLRVSEAVLNRTQWFKVVWKIDGNIPNETKDLPYIAVTDLFKQGPELDAAIKAYAEQEKAFIDRLPKEPKAREEWREYVRTGLTLDGLVNQDLLASIDEQTPEGAIINLVTTDVSDNIRDDEATGTVVTRAFKTKDGSTELNIGHQGMILKTDKGLVVRDASYTWRKVAEMPLANYLFIKFTNAKQKGFNLLKLKDLPQR